MVSVRRGLVSLVLLSSACHPSGPDVLTRATERALGNCSYTVDDDTTEAVTRGTYSADGDLVLQEVVDPSTGDVTWQWKATYGAPHEVSEQRTYAPAGQPESVTTYDRTADGVVTIEVDSDADGEVDSRYVDTVEDGRMVRGEYDQDADGQVDTVLVWAWTETDDGWTVDRTQQDATGDVVATGTDRYDDELRLLASTSDSGDMHEDVAIEGYGDLTWAEHETRTTEMDADTTVTDEIRRTLDDQGRVLEEDGSYEDTYDGEPLDERSWHATWAWTCP